MSANRKLHAGDRTNEGTMRARCAHPSARPDSIISVGTFVRYARDGGRFVTIRNLCARCLENVVTEPCDGDAR